MKHTLNHAIAALGLAIAAMPAFATPTVTVTASTSSTATLAFADHSGAKLGLYMAYGAEDAGSSTNGWANVEYVGAVAPDTDTMTVSLPSGWGTDDKMAARFFLSEVPYPVDYTLDYIQSNGTQYMVPCPKHTPTGASVVEMDVELTSIPTSGAVALFCARKGTGSDGKMFSLLVNNKKWRFDYNGKTGTDSTQNATPAASTRYSNIRVSSAGFYIGDTLVQSCPADSFTTACGGRLNIMALANTTNAPSSVANNKMKLYGFTLTDGDFVLNLVPAVKNGVAGCYDTESGDFIVSAGSAAFVAGTRQETSANPILAASDALEAEDATEILFTDDSDVVDDTDYRTALPGRKIGSGALTFTGDSVFTNGFQVGNGKLILAEGSSFSSTNHVYVGVGNGADSCGHLVISNAVFDLGKSWINANAGSNKGDNTTRVLIYGDDTVVNVGRISLSKGELQIYGGNVIATNDTSSPIIGVALGSGTEACRLYGGTLVSQCVRFSGANSAFEWRGGTFKACATVNGTFFRAIDGVTSPITKTRVGAEGGAFDTNGYTVRITNSLVRINGNSDVAYSRATSMTTAAFKKQGEGTLVFAGANTYVCATEVAAGTLRLETAALPTTGLLRLTGGTVGFHNIDTAIAQTVGNLVGTGTISDTRSGDFSHSLAVTGEIVPGGPDGSLGPITVNGVALSGEVKIIATASGTIPSNIVNADTDALDLSNLAFSVENAENLASDMSRFYLVEGPVTGTASVSGLPDNWIVRTGSDGLSIRAGGFVMVLR